MTSHTERMRRARRINEKSRLVLTTTGARVVVGVVVLAFVAAFLLGAFVLGDRAPEPCERERSASGLAVCVDGPADESRQRVAG